MEPAKPHPYTAAIYELMVELFGVQNKRRQAHLMEVWATYKQRKDLLDRLEEQMLSDVYKAQVLTVLLAPSLKLAPFFWKDRIGVVENYLFGTPVNLSKLPEKLQGFAFSLIEKGVDACLENKELYRMLRSYNDYILQALKILPDSDLRAQRLFDRYQISYDPVLPGEPTPVKADPLYKILHANVPEKWKWRADQQMQQQVFAEREGATRKTLSRYVSVIKASVCKTNVPYAENLLAHQVRFLLERDDSCRQIFTIRDLPPVLESLSHDSYASLRNRLFEHIVNETFVISDQDEYVAAKAALEKIQHIDRDLDPDLQERLLIALLAWDQTWRNKYKPKQRMCL